MDVEFWDTFASDYWQRKPAVFPSAPSIMSAEDILAALKTAFERMLGRGPQAGPGPSMPSPMPVRFFVEGRAVLPPEYAKFVVETKTKTLQEYIDSVSRRLSGARFGVVLNQCHHLVPSTFPRALSFTRPLTRRIGIPAREVELGVFLGTYPMTPFGVHQDPAAVLTIPVLGKKRFLLWPPDYFPANPAQLYLEREPEAHFGHAIELEAKPGELMYWPAYWFHVAHDPNPAPHASLSFGIWSDADPASQLSDALRVYLGSQGVPGRYEAEVLDGALPDELNKALTCLEAGVRTGEIRRKVEETWRQTVRNAGYALVPSGVDVPEDR